MRKINLILFIVLLTACGEQKEYIIQTDMSLLIPDTVNGETVAQSREKGLAFDKKVRSNTVGKYLPKIPVYDLSGKKHNLQNVVSKKTIFISSDKYCGFGQASLFDDFPAALDSLQDELQDYDIICLAKRTEWDDADSSDFENFISELQGVYDRIYIIEESDAYKINLYSNPVRYYIDKDQKVAHVAYGTSNVQGQILEIRRYTDCKTDS